MLRISAEPCGEPTSELNEPRPSGYGDSSSSINEGSQFLNFSVKAALSLSVSMGGVELQVI